MLFFEVEIKKFNAQVSALFNVTDLTMEDFLKIVEEPSHQQQQQVDINAARLKFFNTKVKIWDFVGLSFSDYQKLSVEDRSSILKSYYAEMCKRFFQQVQVFFFWTLWAIFYQEH